MRGHAAGEAASGSGLFLNTKIRKTIDIIIQILTLVFGGYVAFYGTTLLDVVRKRVAPITRLSMRWFYLVLPIMGALFVLLAIENLIALLKKGPTVEKEGETA